jgi:ABC-type Zn2+ transport system substrate-binding protein/surface adhesin
MAKEFEKLYTNQMETERILKELEQEKRRKLYRLAQIKEWRKREEQKTRVPTNQDPDNDPEPDNNPDDNPDNNSDHDQDDDYKHHYRPYRCTGRIQEVHYAWETQVEDNNVKEILHNLTKPLSVIGITKESGLNLCARQIYEA